MSWQRIKSDGQDWQELSIPIVVPAGVNPGETFHAALSDAILNASGSNSSVDQAMDVVFEIVDIELEPAQAGDPAPFFVVVPVVLEDADGILTDMADASQQSINQFVSLPTTRQFIIQNGNPSDQSNPISILGGFKINANKIPSESMKVGLAIQDARQGGPNAIKSVTVNGRFRLYS